MERLPILRAILLEVLSLIKAVTSRFKMNLDLEKLYIYSYIKINFIIELKQLQDTISQTFSNL